MKKFLMTFVLLVGIVAGLFAQKLTYQAVIRDNNQQLEVNTAVKATVTITFTSGAPYQAEFNGSTNLHGLLSIEFGDESLVGRDWTGATIAVKVVNAATPSIVYVNDEPRPVSAVPYALSVDGMAIQQYLTEHKYVTEMQVGNQIHDSISNVAKSHTHSNKALLDTYTQTEANLADAVGKKHSHENMAILNATMAPYTDADSTKLDGIESGAQKNVQSDWKQTDNAKDDYIKNKPSITDTVNNILTTGKYVTETTLDGRRYLTSDSAVITAMQGNISTNKTNIQTNAGTISALTTKEQSDSLLLAGRIDALENASMDCNDVKDCIKDTLSKYTPTTELCDVFSSCQISGQSLADLLQGLKSQISDLANQVDEQDSTINAQNDRIDNLKATVQAQEAKINSLARKVDSLSRLISGGDTTFFCGKDKLWDVDSNEYNTVLIGNQCWMKENLRTTKYADGTSIYLIPATSTIMSDTAAYCYNPNGDESKVSTYGYLYNWKAVMSNFPSSEANPSGVRGICPAGWHVPSDAEWKQLTNYEKSKSEYQCNGSANNIANALSSPTGWTSPGECCAGDSMSETINKTGFSAVPAGCFYGYFLDFGDRAYFWSATENDGYFAWFRNLHSDDFIVNRANDLKEAGFSVRCLRDAVGSSATLPTVTTTSVTSITHNSATSVGDVTSEGGANVTARGVCWSTNPNPTIADSHTTDSGGTGSFTSGITGLTDTTTYYVRAYATNSVGTAYGSQVSFTTAAAPVPCPGVATVTDYDNNTYNTVQIGSQCWMKENLKTTHYANGTFISLGSSTSTTTTAYRYYPNNSSSNVSTYGYLYNWPAVMYNSASSSAYPSGVQGICPTGWHVPSDAEWTQLTTYIKSQPEYVCDGCSGTDNEWVTFCIAKALASTTTSWTPSDFPCGVGNIPSSNNATGFSAVPAGFCHGDYIVFGGDACFWSATQRDSIIAYFCALYTTQDFVIRNGDYKSIGFSVRCLKDEGGSSATLPTVITDSVTNITHNSATSGGDVTTDGGANVTARGVCWSTNQNPTIADSHTADSSGTGSFSSSITGLSAGTTYYVRAYATNSKGTAYGEEVSFTTNLAGQPCPGAAKVTDYDNNEYNTVKIGNQCWMKENLKTTHYANGTAISNGGTNTSTSNAYLYYPNNSSGNVSTYGYLYNWPAVMGNFTSSETNPSGVHGICPTGWHVPSEAEWDTLTNYVNSVADYKCGGTDQAIANALSSSTGWKGPNACCAGHNSTTLNKTGFSAVPAGYSGGYGRYYYFGSAAYFWSATQFDSGLAYSRYLGYDNATVSRSDYNKVYGFSVRCLKDN